MLVFYSTCNHTTHDWKMGLITYTSTGLRHERTTYDDSTWRGMEPTKAAARAIRGELTAKVVECVRKAQEPLTAFQIADRVGCTYHQARSALYGASRYGRVRNLGRGEWGKP